MEYKRFKAVTLISLLLFFTFLSHAQGKNAASRLPEELQSFKISDQFIKSPSKEVGSIKAIKGKGRLVVLRRTDQSAYYANEGDPVYENDALYTLTDCRSRILFKDKNVVVMAPDSHLDIDEVYDSLFEGKKRSRFGMMKGKALFYALRLFRYKEMSLDLKTPTASIGVRGTKFGSEIERVNREKSEASEPKGSDRRSSSDTAGRPAQNIITRAYVFEGEIEVTSLIDDRMKRLRENEILEADRRGLGEIVLDPGRTKTFLGDVLSGIEATPAPESRSLREGFRRESLDRLDKMDDIRQRQFEPPVQEQHPSPGN